jgi:ketosteroid isomerase-like protein
MNAAPQPPSPPDSLRLLRELHDRQEILDCIHRYCRAVDRGDRELLLSVYHPDAIDDHGVFVGNREAFADWALAYHAENQECTHHVVTNHICDLEGDTAHTETYWMFSGINKVGPSTLHFGRYIDRFERRNGRWAISARACVIEWGGTLGEKAVPPEVTAAYAGVGPATRDRSDISYRRPLVVRTPGGGK